jgi:hypothetical protein
VYGVCQIGSSDWITILRIKMIRILKSIVVLSLLISSYAYAEVAHPENPNIVGGVFVEAVCFNNDGAVASIRECNISAADEGYVAISAPNSSWFGGGTSGINGCGISAVNPVSSATCPFILGIIFADCTPNEYILVQTTKSGHFWAVKGDGSCTEIATPETTGLVPCLLTDAFDPVRGCYPVNDMSSVNVAGGYIKLETATTPEAAHCDDVTHEGRMIVDSVNGKLYICTQVGWESISTDLP